VRLSGKQCRGVHAGRGLTPPSSGRQKGFAFLPPLMSNVRPQQMSCATSRAFVQSSSARFAVRAALSRFGSAHGSACSPAESQRRQLRSRRSVRSAAVFWMSLVAHERLQQAGTAALVSCGTRGWQSGSRSKRSTARARKAAASSQALVRYVSAAPECAA
jgi:hypothetical protein